MNFWVIVLILACIGGGLNAFGSWIENKDKEGVDTTQVYGKAFAIGVMLVGGGVFGYYSLMDSKVSFDQDIMTGNPSF